MPTPDQQARLRAVADTLEAIAANPAPTWDAGAVAHRPINPGEPPPTDARTWSVFHEHVHPERIADATVIGPEGAVAMTATAAELRQLRATIATFYLDDGACWDAVDAHRLLVHQTTGVEYETDAYEWLFSPHRAGTDAPATADRFRRYADHGLPDDWVQQLDTWVNRWFAREGSPADETPDPVLPAVPPAESSTDQVQTFLHATAAAVADALHRRTAAVPDKSATSHPAIDDALDLLQEISWLHHEHTCERIFGALDDAHEAAAFALAGDEDYRLHAFTRMADIRRLLLLGWLEDRVVNDLQRRHAAREGRAGE